MTPAQLLTVIEAVRDKCVAADTLLDWFVPTPMVFNSKADMRQIGLTDDTQTELETTPVYALWIDYLRFEDSDRESHSPVTTLFFDITVFHEGDWERIDETVPLDDFEKLVLKTKQDHVADIMGLVEEFRGLNPIALGADFAVAEAISIAQPSPTQRDVPCRYIRDGRVIGSQTNLECAVRVQLVAC
jgi:hypothetical protein